MKFWVSMIVCSLIAGQLSAKQITLTCQTMFVDDQPLSMMVFTAELDTSNSTIVWSSNSIRTRKTDLSVKENMYTWQFDCDASTGGCVRDVGSINRLNGQFFYGHVFPGEHFWTTFNGECATSVKKLF